MGNKSRRRKNHLVFGMTLALIFFSFALVVYTLAFYRYLDPESKGWLALFDLFPVLAAAMAALAALDLISNLSPGDPPRKIWLLFLASLLLDLAAELTWFIYEVALAHETPYPSLADLFWLSAYLPFLAGLYIIISGYLRLGLRFRKGSLLFVVPVSIVILVLITAMIAAPLLTDPEASLADRIINPAYVYLDFAVLVPALILAFSFSKGYHGKPWQLIAYAFILFAAADIIFAHLSWNGSYTSGNHIDLLWIAGYLVLGLAALYQRDILVNETPAS